MLKEEIAKKESKSFFIVALVVLLLIAAVLLWPRGKKETPSEELPLAEGETTMTEAKKLTKPEMEIDQGREYLAILNTTAGTIKIKLYADKTPITVNNFVYLARNNFYDNTIFHRTIAGFMIQGGDPSGDGSGGPGYRFDDEPFEGDYKRGTLAMANAGPNTNGSQFFIMHQDYPLSPDYVIFGEIIEGIEVVDQIATAPTKPEGEGSTPVNPVQIQTVAIEEN